MSAIHHVLEDVAGVRLVLGTADGRERVSWDREHGLSIASTWRPRFRYPAARVAFADIDRVQIAIAIDFGLTLSVRFRRRRGVDHIVHDFTVRDLDLHTEALDLAFRIATILRFEGYVVRPGAGQTRTIELLRDAPAGVSPFRMHSPIHEVSSLAAGPSPQAIDEVRSPAAYDALRARFVEPEPPVRDLSAGETVGELRVVTWDPPRLVELHSPRSSTTGELIWTVALMLVVSLVLLVLAALPLVGFAALGHWMWGALFGPDYLGIYEVMDVVAVIVILLTLAALLITGAAALWFVAWAMRELLRRLRAEVRSRGGRQLRVDLARGLVTIDAGHYRREVRLSEVEGVVQRSRVWAPGETWSEVELQLPGNDELVLVSPGLTPHDTGEILRVTVGLARVLEVPWRVDGGR